ncbi:hypothetical protein GPS61_13925 [Acinetobacter haemolyticus]|uniref:hypothetical protein n=1 Tax=Acinetobacter haemolyticus TaxID=29430 RepID=UPI0013732770|nr:hypothetical protein [Acinetobacter haemolyticus]NAR30839.1 hypothetical protein [Acinetobacter haemolyticus]
MVLPLVPLLIGAGAAAAGAYGVKKGVGAKSDFDRAKRIFREAENKLGEADDTLEEMRIKTSERLTVLGATRVAVVEQCYLPFKKALQGIKNIDISQIPELDGVDVENRLHELEKMSVSLHEIVSGIGAAGASGALTALAAYGGTQMLAAASTGTAISTLSGAAATNATLAWLGGGSLAAGGFGMTGGMVVLGGVVAGPVLAVGGAILAASAETAVNDAKRNLAKAHAIYNEKMIAAKTTRAIGNAAHAIAGLIEQLSEIADELIKRIEKIREQKDDYQTFTQKEKADLANAFLCMGGISALVKAPLIKENGALDVAIRDVRDQAKDLVDRLNSI